MIEINIKADVDALRMRFSALDKNQVNSAIARGINKTLTQGRTVARKAVKEVYTIAQNALPGNIDIVRAKRNMLRGFITANAKPVAMDDFKFKFVKGGTITTAGRKLSKDGQRTFKNTSTKKTGPGTLILEAQRGKVQKLAYAFVVPNVKRGVYARGAYKSGDGSYGFVRRHNRIANSKGNDKLTFLTSVTVHAAVINPKTEKLIAEKIQGVYLKNITHELEYQMSKMS